VRGREAGVRPEVIEALRAQGDLGGLNPHERLLVDLTHSLLRNRTLSQDLVDRGLSELGRQKLIELIALVGHYVTIGMMLNSFDVPAPEEATRTF
jgi:4-carboxymuconolactone decarboxylase